MLAYITKAPMSRRTLIFGSTMHIWSDLFFALMVPLLPAIKEDLDLSFAQVGLLRAVFSGASGVLQIPAGFLAESMGEFWLLVMGNVWVSVGLVAMAASPIFIVLLVVTFVGGLGGGAQHPLASSMVSRAYDARGRSTAVGTVNFAGDIGKMIAPLVAGLLAIHLGLGWRWTMVIVGVIGLTFMLFSMLTRKSVNIGKPTVEEKAAAEASESGSATKLGGFVTLSVIGVLDSATRGATLVFIPFVLDAKDISTGEISVLLALLFVGGGIGKFVVGWLGDRFDTVTLIWGTKGITAVMLVLSLYASPIVMVPLIVVLGIGLNGTSSILYATVAEFVPNHRRARYYGFFYTSNEIGTVLAPVTYGLIADLYSLNTTMIVMGIFTACILPASLSLRRYLKTKIIESSDTIKQG